MFPQGILGSTAPTSRLGRRRPARRSALAVLDPATFLTLLGARARLAALAALPAGSFALHGAGPRALGDRPPLIGPTDRGLPASPYKGLHRCAQGAGPRGTIWTLGRLAVLASPRSSLRPASRSPPVQPPEQPAST
jgi:hypothetical protein